MSAKKTYDDVEFDWIQLSSDLDSTGDQSFWGKWKRKMGENPFVPFGCVGAVGALSYGLVSMLKGNRQHSQYAMRARIGFQGFAIAALIIGFIYGPGKKKISSA